MIEHAFTTKFINSSVEHLRGKTLLPALRLEVLKTKDFWLNGTHLTCALFQGTELEQLTHVSNVFKKGVETRIAAEFNSPLRMDNLISIGKSINTEFIEHEITAGFTLEQLHSLLITNGTQKNRELLVMKIVRELIKERYPSVLFDQIGE